MYKLHTNSINLGVLVSQLFALFFSWITSATVLVFYNLFFLKDKKKHKKLFFVMVVLLMIFIHFILSLSFGWKSVHHDQDEGLPAALHEIQYI